MYQESNHISEIRAIFESFDCYLLKNKGMAHALHLFNTCEQLILQRCRFCRPRSLILGRNISEPDSLLPTDLLPSAKRGRQKI